MEEGRGREGKGRGRDREREGKKSLFHRKVVHRVGRRKVWAFYIRTERR